MRRLSHVKDAITSLAIAGLAAAALSGCGASYQPSRAVDFQLDREAEINDDDIRKAFEARPQMPRSSIKIAYYTFDPQIVPDLETTLAALPGVAQVYRIPPLLVTGQRRLNEGDVYMGGPPREVSVKKLRLLAARAGADVLILVDHGYRNIGANPLIALVPLIVPIFFVPFIDTTVKGYSEAFVMDVRNGYLYGHLVKEDERGEGYATIYAKSAGDYAKEQWVDLRAALQKELASLVEGERNRPSSAATPAGSEAPPPPPPPPSSGAP